MCHSHFYYKFFNRYLNNKLWSSDIMRLEKVLNHKLREDLYINKIITPHQEIKPEEKMLINEILLKEVLNRRL